MRTLHVVLVAFAAGFLAACFSSTPDGAVGGGVPWPPCVAAELKRLDAARMCFEPRAKVTGVCANTSLLKPYALMCAVSPTGVVFYGDMTPNRPVTASEGWTFAYPVGVIVENHLDFATGEGARVCQEIEDRRLPPGSVMANPVPDCPVP